MIPTRADILRGLEGDEFYPVFQPMVELRTGELAGFEVLARWQPPGSAMIMPAEFIPVLEQTQMIDRLTEALLRKAFACAVIAERPLMLSFNLSTQELLDRNLAKRLEGIADAGGFPLDRLTLEITESALVDDLARAREVAQELKALRCCLALDDFGTGYSSLTHLHALPFDELKVDRSFVASMADTRESREIVASVVGLGQGLGLITVAEGVETHQQAEMLFWMGCDLAQGWHYGHPLAAQDVPQILAQPAWKCPVDAGSAREIRTLESLQALPAHRLAQLQAIYDGAPVGLCLLDRNLRYVSLNQHLARMNGAPAAAHLGRRVDEVIPQVFPLVEPFLRRVLAGESVTGVEVTKPHGQTLMLSYRPVRDAGGEVVGVSVAVMDVTQRRHIEEALHEAEEHFRHLMQLGPHVPWVLNADGGVIAASPRWEQYTGQPLTQAMGHGWLQMLHPEDVQPTQEAIRRTLESGLPIDVEYRVRQPNGGWIWMRSRGCPRFTSAGQVLSIYGVVEEMEGPPADPGEVKYCKEKLWAALNAVPVGIVLADGQDGTIDLVNPAAQATFGQSLSVGQKLGEFAKWGLQRLNGEPVRLEEHPLVRTLQHDETIESQPFLHRRSDGSQSEVLLSSRTVHSDDGRLVGVMVIVLDPQVDLPKILDDAALLQAAAIRD